MVTLAVLLGGLALGAVLLWWRADEAAYQERTQRMQAEQQLAHVRGVVFYAETLDEVIRGVGGRPFDRRA